MKCRICNLEKSLDQFVKNKKCKFGVEQCCRICANEYLRNWKKEHKDRIKEQQQNMYKQNKGWYTKERFKESIIDFSIKHPFRMRARLTMNGIKVKCKQKNIPYDEIISITYLEKLFENNPFCNCCGVELDYQRKFDKIKHDNSPSLDRFIPIKGYVKNNIYVLCWKCNNIKRNYTSDDLITVANWIKEISGNTLDVDVQNLISLNTISAKI